MLPDFIKDSYLSETDKETFLCFYNKSVYYEDMGGHYRKVPDEVFERILEKWDVLPDKLKENVSLLALAKYIPQNDYSSDDYFEPKEFGMSQINYNREYFPSDEAYEKMCAELESLPDDRRIVYDYLHAHSMFNLNYVPNKIRLIDEFVSDNINISFEEKNFGWKIKT